jgi:hypothetical protein
MMIMMMINLKCGRKNYSILGYYSAIVVIPYRRFGTTKTLTLEAGTDRLSRNDDKKLPLLAE